MKSLFACIWGIDDYEQFIVLGLYVPKLRPKINESMYLPVI